MPPEATQSKNLIHPNVHVDLVGPLPVSKDGHTHLMTMIDRSTRQAEVVPLKSTTAETCADMFLAQGGAVWQSAFHHHRQRHTVYLIYLELLVPDDWHRTHPHHCITPAEQRDG